MCCPAFEWQMPQGGIDPAEDIIAAARRELAEETGVTEAEFLAVTEEWWAYDFPLPYTPTGHRLEAFRGQQQRWAAFRFTGAEGSIDLTAMGADFAPEFSEWRWATLDEAVAGVMPYKRPNYAKVAAAFAGLRGLSAFGSQRGIDDIQCFEHLAFGHGQRRRQRQHIPMVVLKESPASSAR